MNKGLMQQSTESGRAIENSSFTIIDREIGAHSFSKAEWEIVRRVIHSTADFEFKELIKFQEQAIISGVKALKAGSSILTDVKMIKQGLNQERLSIFKNKSYCFIGDDSVSKKAELNKTTKALESVKKAFAENLLNDSIIAIGNAPTFLLEICSLIRERKINPALVIAVPVGFVSAAESKSELAKISGELSSTPYIISQGRKGGSTIAVAIIHALLEITTWESI